MNRNCHLAKFILVAALVLMMGATSARAAGGEKGKELYQAVLFQDMDQIKSLIAAGADTNYIENGRPILGWAAQNGNVEVVKMLIAGKADVNLADKGIGHTPLMRAIDTQQTEIVKALIAGKANPNAKTPDGESCLTMAVKSRKPEIVRTIVEAGANVKEVSADGDSPALAAAQDGSTEAMEIIRILGKAGADLNVSNAAYTPLSYAVEQSNTALVKTLLEAGADPNAKTQGGRAPIHLASDNKEILELLLKAKANPNLEDGSGGTALIAAIENNKPDIAKVLLEAGADATKPLPNGDRPLDSAKRYGQTELAELLSKYDKSAATTAGAIPIGSGPCTIVDAAKMQMELHGKLQAQVNAGKMSSEIFRTFNEDTKEYGDMLVRNPAEACALFERLTKKYGV